ncbi:MAG: LytTR family DNA-binding domain-containing protein [Glaciimonas sp.]|nr:LytTR family DNA-binding domain-containing protein [Glaciimonas sp.]
MHPRIFIVDDEAPARARLQMLLSDISIIFPHQIVGEVAHAQDALDGIAATSPDVVLMDVQMPGMTGLQLAQQLMQQFPHQEKISTAIIFVTAYDDYAVNAFDVHACDYLLKPVRAERLQQALMCANRLRLGAVSPIIQTVLPTSGPTVRSSFSVQERGRVLLVPVADVLYLKAELKYLTLRTKTKEYLLEDSLTAIEDELQAHFVRVHRNALVARKAIIGVERAVDQSLGKSSAALQDNWQVILRELDIRLLISRRQWGVIRALVR